MATGSKFSAIRHFEHSPMRHLEEEEEEEEEELVYWCFEPPQPLGIISGPKTNFNSSLSYSAHKSFNSNP